MRTLEKLKWTTTKRRVKDLLPWEKNPRRLTTEQAEQLKTSIEKFDLAEIPAVDTDGRIVAGHQRVATLKLLGRGAELIDVRVPSRKLSAAEFREYNLRSNKNTGEWDLELLGDMDEALLKSVGFSPDELDNIFKADAGLTDPDEVPPLPEKARTRPGDMYELGEHRLMCGDSTSETDVALLMGGAGADMIFTDPPYNVGYVGKGKKKLTIQNDSMAEDQFCAFLTKAFSAMRKTCAGGAPYYVCHADVMTATFRRALLAAGFEVKQTLIWSKSAFVLGRQDYQWQHEPILYGWAAGASHRWFGGRAETTVWNIARPAANDEHPTMKPVELCARAIGNSSRRGGNVLDLFGGSGSTLIACEQLKRRAYLMELDPKYADVIIERWEKFTGQKAKRAGGTIHG